MHIKGNVALKYSLETNLTAVKQRLDEKFMKLNSSKGSLLVQRIISHVDDRIKELEQEIREEDESKFPATVLDENDSDVTDSVESMDS